MQAVCFLSSVTADTHTVSGLPIIYLIATNQMLCMLFSPISSWLSLSITRVLPWNGLNHSLPSFCGHWREPAKTHGAVKCGTTRCRSLEMEFLMFNHVTHLTTGWNQSLKMSSEWINDLLETKWSRTKRQRCIFFSACGPWAVLEINCSSFVFWIGFFFSKNTAWKRFSNSRLSNPDMLQSPWMRQ